MKKIIYILLLGNSFYCNAQLDKTIHEMTKPSPEVASLGKYGELPINHYTGIANIDVPLHEIDFDGLKIPISLNYSTGGIKPSEEASWVGLGWSLSAEPIITRNIRGLGDIDQIGMQVGYPYTTIALPEHSYDLNYPSPLWDKLILHEQNYNIIDTWDTEPDIFSVSLFGETAKFILTQKSLNGGIIGVKLLNEDSRLKVEYMETGKNFVVTNERGFSFYFNKKEYSVVGVEGLADNYTVYQGFDNPQVTGWKIEKIISPKGNTLFYEYHPTASIKDQPVASEKKHITACPTIDNYASFNAYANSDIRPSRSMNFHASLYLKAIYCDNYRIDFAGSERSDIMDGYDNSYPMQSISGFYNGHALKLDEISIKDFRGQPVKTIKLNYTYFNDANTYPYFKKEYLRLKLNSAYMNNEFFRSFEYINPNLLPGKRTTSIDYWGYYNGRKNLHRYPSYKTNKFCSSITTTTLVRIFGANLLPDFNYGKNGLLNKITYPTKGYSSIAYEPHSIVLNTSTKNTKVPFEDFEVFETASYDEASPSDSEIFVLNGQEVDHMFIEGDTPNSAKSLFGHIVVEIGCGSGFSNTNLPSYYRKCDVLPSDGVKIAFQLINADNGEVVKMARFSMDTNCFVCPPISIPNGVFERNILLSDLPAGRYFLRARALKHISNLLDEEEGIYPGNPDYMKQYYFPVRIKATIPKSALYTNYNKEIGGARIQKITNFDSDDSFISKKEYRYITDTIAGAPILSSGILLNELDYGNEYIYGANDFLCPTSNSCASGCMTRALTVYSENRRLQLSPVQNHIGYKRVEEMSMSNSATGGIGKTVYYFSADKNESVFYYNLPAFTIYRPMQHPNAPDLHLDQINLALAPKRTYEESNGDLLKTEYFDGQLNIKRKEENTYYYHHLYFPRKIGIGMHIKFHLNYSFDCLGIPEISGTVENMQIYEIKNEATPIQKKTITEFLPGGNVATSTEYSYNGKYLPSVIATASSEGTPSTIKNYYPGDSETAGFPNSSTLVSKNIIGSPMRSEKFSGTGLLEQVDKEYSLFNANTLLAESKMKALKGGGLMEDLFEYQLYDSRGNVLQYKKASGIPVSVIWGYKSGLPVAKLENVEYSSISVQAIANIQSKSETGTEAELITALNSLRASFTDAMVTTYTYRPLIGMSSLTDPKGLKTTYSYDTFGRLEFIRDNDGNVITHNQYHYKL